MKTIAAISTAQGVGGIGVIRVSGDDAISIAEKIFIPYVGEKENCLKNLKGYTAKYGKISDGEKLIDDVVVLVFRAPRSYTGEDVVEISCHGGLFLTRRILRLLIDEGAEIAKAGEFTKRAFLNGKIDLSQAEAVMDLIYAKSEKSNEIAFNIREGKTGKKINAIKEKIIDIMAELSVWSDYPEEEDTPNISRETLKDSLKEINGELLKLIDNYDVCCVLKEGIKTAIIGKPNVGKSTLMNMLAGHEKSIVTSIPGTTRDAIEETVMVGDIPLVLVDTAGIRDTDDTIEKIGVEKSRKYIKNSDLILFIMDNSSNISEEDKKLIDLCDKNKTICILNKCDLKTAIDKKYISTKFHKTVEISALNGNGLEKLKSVLENKVGMSKYEPSEMLISNERQFKTIKEICDIISKAIAEIENFVTLDAVTVLLQDTVNLFMEFTGESVGDVIIDKVFSKFCVGK